MSGAGFADNAKLRWNCRQVFKLHGKTIANGFVETRRVGIGNHVFAKNSMHRIGQRYGFRRHSIRPGQLRCQIHDDLDATLNCDHFRRARPAVTT